MRIVEILATFMEMTDAMRGHVEEKVGSLEKFCENYSPCDVRVEIGKTNEHHQKGKIWRAELTMTIPGGSLRAESVQEDLYAAIDEAKNDLKRQLIDFKEKRIAH